MTIKVKEFTGNLISTHFAGEDLWKLSDDVEIWITTDEGDLHYSLRSGFPTNMRSGSHVIDFLIPKFTANNQYNLAILAHDAAYTKLSNGHNPISRALADDLLFQMTKLSKQINSAKAGIMYYALRLAAGSAYNCENEGPYKYAGNYMSFEWVNKKVKNL